MKDMSTKTFNSIVIMFLFKRQLQTISFDKKEVHKKLKLICKQVIFKKLLLKLTIRCTFNIK